MRVVNNLAKFGAVTEIVRRVAFPDASLAAQQKIVSLQPESPVIVRDAGKQQKLEAPSIDKVAQVSGRARAVFSDQGTTVFGSITWGNARFGVIYRERGTQRYYRRGIQNLERVYPHPQTGFGNTPVQEVRNINVNNVNVYGDNNTVNIYTSPTNGSQNATPNRNSALSWIKPGLCVRLAGYDYFVDSTLPDGTVNLQHYRFPDGRSTWPHVGGYEPIRVGPNGYLTNNHRSIPAVPSDFEQVNCPH